MSRLLRLYQYAGPALLAPLGLYLWWGAYRNVTQVMVAWLVPILWAYLVPAVGANVCKAWEFDVRWKLGRFRPHHGFVFGGATSVVAWLVHGAQSETVGEVLRFALILCSVLGFWNLLYEIKALKIGLLKVYNQPWAEGKSEEAIALDYSPWFFGGFGAAYGLSISALEYVVHRSGAPGNMEGIGYVTLAFTLCVAVPVLGFIQHSLRAHGHAGVRPVARE